MKLVSSKQMQALDKRTIEGGFASSLDLMEAAGAKASLIAQAMLFDVIDMQSIEGLPQAVIICGKGNNGGDGLVVARILADQGVDVRVLLTHSPQTLSTDAQANFKRLQEIILCEVLPDTILDPGSVEAPHLRGAFRDSCWQAPAAEKWIESIRQAHLVVDALMGTGVQKKVRNQMQALINVVNANARRTLALDIPSGVDGDTGAVLGTAIWADATVSFGLPKRGLAWHPGRERCGAVHVADIGFPASLIVEVESEYEYFEANAAQELLPRIHPTSHKYQNGFLLIIAGSRKYPGAAVLTSSGALRSGAGMVQLIVPESIHLALETQLPEVIIHPMPETSEGTLAPQAFAMIESLLPRATAVALGPGLDRNDATTQALTEFVRHLKKPVVIDADGLLAVNNTPPLGPRVLTPHTGELSRMMRVTGGDTQKERLNYAQRLADQTQSCVLAKGAPTYVVQPASLGSKVTVNGSGNPGLASAGTGDVLTGVVGALLSQGLLAQQAASLGAYLHGAAADEMAIFLAKRSMTSSDLPDALGRVLADLGA